MVPFIGEIIGTMLLILLGNGVVANVILKNTKGFESGWIVITFGWGMAVFVAVFCVGPISGAHINPAVTLGLAIVGKFEWVNFPVYILGQIIGGCLGAFLVWIQYRQHYDLTEDQTTKLGTFGTIPAIRSKWNNLLDYGIIG